MESFRLTREVALRVARGHPWIYRNELSGLSPDFPAGDLVELVDPKGRFVAVGYCNPKSVITVRVLTREREEIDLSFFQSKIASALSFRKRFYSGESAYRVVYGEADFLPGLIIDRYGEHIVLQVLTAGMERFLEPLLSAVGALFSPHAIVARNDVPSRALEGLPVEKKVITGSLDAPVVISRGGLEFEIDLLEGQKTGFFLDQLGNYQALKGLVDGAEVLDAFCYTGGWSLYAARFGAKTVTGIDSSENAISLARRNADRNRFGSVARFEIANVFDALKEREGRGERYDCVILDPPSFVKRRKEIEGAVRGYKEINLRAMKLLRKGGFLISCSCSYHLSQERFRQTLLDAATDVKRDLRLIAFRSQPKDHPILMSLSETEYLKCAVLQVL
ncbi:MAG TPA: class I SAM-dependent rRNA methyltransferase [Candidatus Manganitrophaceae bacterium]|nr:class I SAM-dependent rRNA methyltransferase [Candidatus Manganitrophaceae bacterium]